jgi:hypothetical protein
VYGVPFAGSDTDVSKQHSTTPFIFRVDVFNTDRGNTCFRNVGIRLPDYTVSSPRRRDIISLRREIAGT